MVSDWAEEVAMGKKLVDEPDEFLVVQSADAMFASQFIRHVHLRHSHLRFRTRENHDQDHEISQDILDHVHGEDA